MILYEYPLNERIRTLLRLEDLFERFELFSAREHPLDHHVAISTLFDLLDAAGRADLKSDLLQELDRQRQTLTQLRERSDVAQGMLEGVLDEIERVWQALSALTSKTGQHLRENDWLMSIRSRSIIAGGACEFDLPSYHAWQHRSPASRRQDLAVWAAPFMPIRDGLAILLRLLRENAQRSVQTSEGSGYQQPLGGKSYQMVRVRISPDSGAIPEISANKYLIWIRFTAQDGDLRPRAFEGMVTFELSLCSLGA